MVADGLTKGLGRNKFEKFVQQVGLCERGNPGFRGSVEMNQDCGWTLVEGRKKGKNTLRKT